MTVASYKRSHNHRHMPPMPVLEPTTAKYLLDFLYFTREDEQFRFYRKVSAKHSNHCISRMKRSSREFRFNNGQHQSLLLLLLLCPLARCKLESASNHSCSHLSAVACITLRFYVMRCYVPMLVICTNHVINNRINLFMSGCGQSR